MQRKRGAPRGPRPKPNTKSFTQHVKPDVAESLVGTDVYVVENWKPVKYAIGGYTYISKGGFPVADKENAKYARLYLVSETGVSSDYHRVFHLTEQVAREQIETETTSRIQRLEARIVEAQQEISDLRTAREANLVARRQLNDHP